LIDRWLPELATSGASEVIRHTCAIQIRLLLLLLLLLDGKVLLPLLQREVISSSKAAVLPSTYQSLAAQAVEYSLACAQLPKDVS